MASKTPTWVWVVLGILGFFVIACVLLIGGGIIMFRQHVHSETASTQVVQDQFEHERARFAGQRPLLEIQKTDADDSRVIVHRPPETAERHTDLTTIRVLAYQPRNGRLVHVDIPAWLARMMMSNSDGSGRRRIQVNGDTIELGSGNLTFEDIERNGPGLVVDFSDGRGAQVLVWAE